MRGAACLVILLVSAIAPVGAQTVTAADIQRLQQAAAAIDRDLAARRLHDAATARALEAELAELRDEITYLSVKLRKEQDVPLVEYTDLRDRLEDLKARARGDEGSTGAYGRPPAPEARPAGSVRTSAGAASIPVGTELDVRLQTPLNSGTARIEDRFDATTLVDLRQDGHVLIPAGSVARGVVTAVKSAGRLDRKGSLSLAFEHLIVNGTTYPIRGTLVQAIESEGVKADAGRIGAGAAVGGLLGGILGGWRGSIAGILLGGGGTMIAREGQQVDLKPGIVLRMRFDEPLRLGR